MDRCKICGGSDPYFVCSQCGRSVCSGCFRPESHLCSLCSEKQKIAEPSELPKGDVVSTFGRLFPLGVSFIFIGMVLMMIASILSAPSEGGTVIFFPFFFANSSGIVALAIMVTFLILSLIIIFLPLILGPKRFSKAAERMFGFRSEDFQPREVKKSDRDEIEDYLITLKVPGFEEEDIEVRVFHNELTVEASKNGEVFKKTYQLPMGFEPEGVKYDYKAGFLVIRVSLGRKEEA